MYHITQTYLGQHPLLKPYIPKCPLEDEKATVKRICVADTVVNAIMGKAGYTDLDKTLLSTQNEIFVYKSNSLDFVKADTPDQLEFNEHWYLHPTLFFYVGKLKLNKDGIIEVGFEVEDHRKLMVPHHINYFDGYITRVELMGHWREEALLCI